MKKLTWVFGGLLLAMVPVFALVSVAHAQRFSTNIDDGQKVYSSLYSTGKTVTIHGEIFGDVFCAGQTVDIDATVHGDVICAGQDVTVSGKVDGNVRVGGQTVSIDADITRSATVAAANFSLDATAKVGQDLTATGGALNIKGHVQRDATVSGTSIVFNGPIGRNIAAQSEDITLKGDAKISGNLNYTASSKPKELKGATVQGKTTEIASKKSQSSFFNPMVYLFTLSSLVLIGVVLALLFPKYLERTSAVIRENPSRTLLVGGATSVIAPAMAFAFGVTIIGIPLAIFTLLALAFAVALSGPIVGYYVGQLVMSNSKSPVLIAIVGSAIVVTSYFVPLIGIAFILAALWFGLGALITDLQMNTRATRKTAKSKK